MRAADVPAELFDLIYTVTENAEIKLAVCCCRMCGSLIPDGNRTHHRDYHVAMAQMLNERMIGEPDDDTE